MKAMKFFLVATLLALAGCAALDKSSWTNDPAQYEEVTVRWLRMPGTGFVDQDGICNVQLIDSEAGLQRFYSQVQACKKAEVRQVATEAMKEIDSKKIRIFAVKTSSDVQNKSIDIFGMRSYKAAVNRSASSICWQGIDCKGIVGFVFDGYGWSGIVIARGYMYAAGHEMKHVYDGLYHYSNMRWKEPGKAFFSDPATDTKKVGHSAAEK